MSAIASAGYPDWQRLTNWDGPVLYSLANGTYSTTQTSPLMRVDRYHALGGYMQFSAGACHIAITWYADAAGTILMGGRDFYVDGTFANPLQFRLVNLGAWCKVQLIPIGANFAVSTPVQIAPTNRSFPAETTPDTTLLASTQIVGLAAGATQVANVGTLMTGKAHLWVAFSTSVASAGINVFQSNNTYLLMQDEHVDNQGYINRDFILPSASVQLKLTNLSAAVATVNCTLTASGGA